MNLYKPEKIYIKKEAQGFPVTKHVLEQLPDVPVEIIDHPRDIQKNWEENPDPIGKGKRNLLLTYDQGRSFKIFPETEDYLSCDYYTLHVAEGCDLECSYCILQSYLTSPFLTLHVNIEEMLEGLQETLNQNANKFYRIGIGQLADALSLDHLTGFSKHIVPFFAKQKNAVLELKTKSTNIENLLDLEPNNRTIVAWSLNAKKIAKEEEHKCATIEERITAARRIIDTQKYRLAFHFDPIVEFEGWEKGYEEVIDELFKQIPEESIAWISIGCLRMMKPLKKIMSQRFPKSDLPYGEWITGMDGKLRYFKPVRIAIYQKIVKMIRDRAPNVTIYLSMESHEVWKQVLGLEVTKQSVCELLNEAGRPKVV